MKLFEIYKGVKCYGVNSFSELEAFLKCRLNEKRGFYSMAINAEKLIRASEDEIFKSIIINSELPIPDGIAAILLIKKKYNFISLKVDLPKTILEFSNKYCLNIGLIGATENSNLLACKNISITYPNLNIAYRSSGYRDLDKIRADLRNIKLDIILVGLGSPKQEKFSHQISRDNQQLLIINCGGAIDVLSGNIKRAPEFFQKNNLEWFYRLVSNPRRIKRQLKLYKFLKIYLVN